MLKYKLTKVIEDKFFGKYEFTYKFFTSDDDSSSIAWLFSIIRHIRECLPLK